MTKTETPIVVAAEQYVKQFYEEHFKGNLPFHDFQHFANVVHAAQRIGEAYDLTDADFEVLCLAAWFHDLGYYESPEGHEARSAELAAAFLESQAYPAAQIEQVKACILATRLPQSPNNLLEKILCDADLSHLGNANYWDRCGRLRQEMTEARGIVMSEPDWVEFEIDFLMGHRYHTDIARELFSEQKLKHIRQLNKQLLRLNPDTLKVMQEEEKSKKKKKK
ncbi:MAG: HD domain-containing protein, partial [Phaeodactylibacter sp.]|nr:HD domain-containing protein [Phaeodactylibacter sp.]